MILKGIVEEDFTNYKLPVMQLIFPKCSFKCGKGLCQNSPLTKSPDIEFDELEIIHKYVSNNITHGILCAGFEPFDSPSDLSSFAHTLRQHTNDVLIIFTGYTEEELQENITYIWLSKNITNLIIKFGRYKPGNQKHYDNVLGIYLASDNQYAERISQWLK